MSDDIIFSGKAPEPVGSYPHARKAGHLLFLSGIGPREAGSNSIPKEFEAQCHAVFRNVRSVLESAGSRWEDLVDITVFLTDMQKDFPVYNKIYADYFAEHQPCRTTVGINSLPTAISIELKCIAYLP